MDQRTTGRSIYRATCLRLYKGSNVIHTAPIPYQSGFACDVEKIGKKAHASHEFESFRMEKLERLIHNGTFIPLFIHKIPKVSRIFAET